MVEANTCTGAIYIYILIGLGWYMCTKKNLKTELHFAAQGSKKVHKKSAQKKSLAFFVEAFVGSGGVRCTVRLARTEQGGMKNWGIRKRGLTGAPWWCKYDTQVGRFGPYLQA